MASEVNEIKKASEVAIEKNDKNPDFSEAFRLLSNNTTAEEQKQERSAVNAVLHEKFPQLDLIGNTTYKDKAGTENQGLILYNTETNSVQLRQAKDFGLLQENNMTEQVKNSGVKPQEVSDYLGAMNDKMIAQSPEQSSEPKPTTSKGAAVPAEQASGQATAPGAAPAEQPKEFVYEAKKGDTLWHIAKTQIEAASPKDSVVSAASVKSYIEQIVASNKDQIKDVNLIYAGSKYVLPELKLPEQKAETSEGTAPTTPGSNPSARAGDQAQTPRPREIQRPVAPIARPPEPEPGPDLYSGSRNGAPAEAPAPPLKK